MYMSWSLKFGCEDPLYTFQVYAFASVTVDLAFSSSSLVKFVSIQLWDVRCLSMIGRDLAFSTECSVCTFKQIVHVIWVWVHDVLYVLLSLKFDCKDAFYSFQVYAFASVTVDIVFFLLLWSNCEFPVVRRWCLSMVQSYLHFLVNVPYAFFSRYDMSDQRIKAQSWNYHRKS